MDDAIGEGHSQGDMQAVWVCVSFAYAYAKMLSLTDAVFDLTKSHLNALTT